MKPEWRRFAPIGLYLALVAALISAGLYFVQRDWNLYLQISLGLVVFGLALFAFLDPDRVRQVATGRQARYGSNAFILTIAFIGILVVVNYLAFENPERWDLTEDKEYTLAPETITILENLDQPVEARAFFTSDTASDTARQLLDQYQFYSDGQFTYEFVDPNVEQVQAFEAGITRNGSVVLYQGDQKQIVETVNETSLSQGLLGLTNPETRVVYFLTGHGELTPETTGESSISTAVRDLEAKNYTVNTLNLLSNNSIPEDAKVIIIAGPRQPLMEAEISLLKNFVVSGGGLIVMEEPVLFTEMAEGSDLLTDYLAESWGVQYRRDMIVDLSSNLSWAVALGIQYGSHPVTNQLAGTANLFPTARSVNVSQVSGVTQVTLVSTSANSWSETDMEGLQAEEPSIQYDEGSEDTVGPLSVSVAAENFVSNSRLIAFGDAEFIAGDFYQAASNADLFINSVDWAANEEDLINLTPRETTQRMILPPQGWVLNLVILGSVFILPGLMLLAGIVVWVQRRRRG